MSGFGQRFDGAWLRKANSSLIAPKCAVGAQLSAGATIWSSWLFNTWTTAGPQPFFSIGQLLRSTWLTTPVNQSIPHITPLSRTIATGGGTGSIVWANWWWGTQYLAPNRLQIGGATLAYALAGQDAALARALHYYALLLDATNYDYDGGFTHADLQFTATAASYPYAGEATSFVAPSVKLVQATAIGWATDALSGRQVLRNVGDVFYVLSQNFSDATVDYLAGLPGGPFYGWMKIVPPGTPTTDPTQAGQPFYDYQPPPRRLVF